MEEQASLTEDAMFPNVTGNMTQSPNNSTQEHIYPKELLNSVAACYSIMIISGVSGNLITILALAKCPRLRNATTAFVINLAVADLVFCSFSLPLLAVAFGSGRWIFGDGAVCVLFAFVSYSNIMVSLFTVVTITINRYVRIVHPTSYSTLYRQRNVAIMIAALWMSSFAALCPPLFQLWGKFGIKTRFSCDMLPLNGKSPQKILFSTVVLLPTLSFIFCYYRIYSVVRKAREKAETVDSSSTFYVDKLTEVPTVIHIGRSTVDPSSSKTRRTLQKFYSFLDFKNAQSADTPQVRKRKKELKVLKVAFVIFTTYVLCYFPLSMLKLLGEKEVGNVMFMFSYILAFLANCSNPVIYVALSDEYRKAYFRLIACRAKEATPPTSMATSHSANNRTDFDQQYEVIPQTSSV